jgi:hypothetical protein
MTFFFLFFVLLKGLLFFPVLVLAEFQLELLMQSLLFSRVVNDTKLFIKFLITSSYCSYPICFVAKNQSLLKQTKRFSEQS